MVNGRKKLVFWCALAALGSMLPRAQAREPQPPPASSIQTGLQLEDCKVPGLEETVRCGRYEVFEDRKARTGRRLSLAFVVVPARGPARQPDPVFFFAGGPGESAVNIAGGVAEMLDALRQDRDLVLIDQRGTGKSNPLQCDLGGLNDGLKAATTFAIPRQTLEACRAELSTRADLRLYTTPIAMDDVDDIRAALGYDQINVMGASYGSRTSLVYLRQHPQHVRSVVVRAVNTVELEGPLPQGRFAQQAFDGLADDCARDPACHAAFPDVRGDLAQVLERLEKAPVKLEAKDPRTGKLEQIELTRDVLAGILFFMLDRPEGASQVPAMLHSARNGDFQPFLARAVPYAAGFARFLSVGMTLSSLCAEDIPRITPDRIAPQTAGTFLGEARVRNLIEVCRAWPAGEVPEGYNTPVSSDRPVLLITGEFDSVNGAELARRAAEFLSRGKLVVVPDGSHQPMFPGCLEDLGPRFVRQGSAEGLDFSCVDQVRRPPFALSLEAGKPSTGK